MILVCPYFQVQSEISCPSQVSTRGMAPARKFSRGFARGLRWRSTRPSESTTKISTRESLNKAATSTKRPNFPSWPWASTPGRIEYDIDHCFKIGKIRVPKSRDLSFDSDPIDFFVREDYPYAEIFLEDPRILVSAPATVQENISAMITLEHARVIPERSPMIYIRSTIKTLSQSEWSGMRKAVH